MTSPRSRVARWSLTSIIALAALAFGGPRTLADAAAPAAPAPPPTAAAPAKPAGHDWNDAGIRWVAYDKGIEQAKAEKKPVCLVFFTEWCPHCGRYSAVFHDPRVVEKSKQFVMVRIDRDARKDLSALYKPDGEYIPRTYFLTKDAQLDADLHAPRENFRYFYDESNPQGILGGMDAALQKFASGAAPAPAGGVGAPPGAPAVPAAPAVKTP